MDRKKSPTIRLNASDNVVVALVDIEAGTEIGEEGLVCREGIPAGHKVAAKRIEAGAEIRKYDQIIGFAAEEIPPGGHVHTHNVAMRDFERDYAIGEETRPTQTVPEKDRMTFQGIVREDGRVATRNFIGVLSSVTCSASASKHIADAFRGDALAEFPNVDGVVALCHGTGCGMAGTGEGMETLQRTVAGYAQHPNFAGVLLVGLGCEVLQIDDLLESAALKTGARLQAMTIQESGGTQATIREAVERVREMLPYANAVERRPVPASHLILGLECGGSDAYSGITANPALGAAADILVRQGGTAVLSETPEIYGAEHLLTRRAITREVGEKLIARIRWWEDYTARRGGKMDNNPSPGNKAGGLTTILEKSLGAASKGGTTNLVEVYRYGERVEAKGFVFMDTPGYDAASITGMIAGGANILCFTTGRGSGFGSKPVPVIKLATNTPMYERLEGDMDINCGTIVDGKATIEEMGEIIFRRILETASGTETKSELQGMGDYEFVPWQIGATM